MGDIGPPGLSGDEVGFVKLVCHHGNCQVMSCIFCGKIYLDLLFLWNYWILEISRKIR